MSSVLKALKKQSSPLVSGSSQVHLSSAKSSATLWNAAKVRIVLRVLLLLIAAALGWLTMQWWLAQQAKPVETLPSVTVSEPQVRYELGQVSTIKTPQWPQPEAMQADVNNSTEGAGQVLTSRAQQQVSQRPVSGEQAIDLSEVSPELLSAFENALAAESTNASNRSATSSERVTSVVPPLTQLNPSFQRTIASFSYDGHQYSSRPQSRWIELSGVRLFEGEQFQGLTILTIAPAHVVLAKDNQAFQQPALEDWTRP